MKNALTDADLDAIKARWERAVGGLWFASNDNPLQTWNVYGGGLRQCVLDIGNPGDTANAIAHAPEDIAALLAEVRRLQELIEDIRLEDHASHCEWD